MYILNRWYLLHMADWISEPIAVSDKIESLSKHEAIDGELFIVDSFHGHDPDKQGDFHYTIESIESI